MSGTITDIITPVPDHVGATVMYLRQWQNLTDTFPGVVIRSKIPDDQPSFTPFILVQKSGGGGENLYVPYYWPRIDVRCYGKTDYEAMRLWRYVHPILVPQSRRGGGWIHDDCQIVNVIMEGAPIPLEEPDDNWPFVLAVYREQVMQVPI